MIKIYGGAHLKIICFSRNLNSLNINDVKTSSGKYELGVIKELSKFFHIYVFSTNLNDNNQLQQKNIYLRGIKNNKKDNYDILSRYINEEQNKEIIMLIHGYDLKMTYNIYKITRGKNIKIINYVYDTHKVATEQMIFLKRILANFYFEIALHIMKKFDGFIFFQETAAKLLNIDKPYIISKPAININEIKKPVYTKKIKDSFNVVFAGTLNSVNGIKLLLNTILMIKEENIYFRIFGDGPLKELVIKQSSMNSNVYYGGLVSQKELEKEFLNADLLLNLRDPSHFVTQYAFPSKLVEYMSKNVPVLSTDFGLPAEMKKGLFILNHYDQQELKLNIYNIYNMYKKNNKTIDKKVLTAHNYLKTYLDWQKIIKDKIIFFQKFYE